MLHQPRTCSACMGDLALRAARSMPAAQLQLPETPQTHASAANARMRVRIEALDCDAVPQQVTPHITESADIGLLQIPRPPAWIWIVTMCTLAILICYADRANISFAIVSMSSEFHWSESYKGTILSVFFIGYAGTQLLGGALADRLGGKHVLAAGVFAWSAFTFVTPEAAAGGTFTLIACRIAMGLGEGIAFPAVHSIISTTVPRARHSTAVAVVTAASYAGAAAASFASPWIISNLSWQAVFYIFGASAATWLPCWFLMPFPTAAAPTVHVELPQPTGPSADGVEGDEDERPTESANEDEQQLLASAAMLQTQLPGPRNIFRAIGMDAGFIALMQRKEVWAIGIAQYCQSWGLYVLLSWLPTYFTEQYNINANDLGGYTVLPPLVQAVVGGFSGVLADSLIQRGIPIKGIRRWLQIIGMMGPAGCLLLAVSPAVEDSPATAAALITAAQGFSALTLAGVSVSHLDIAPRHAGAIFGFGNTLATVSGLLGTKLTGEILQLTASWTIVFSVTAAHFVLGSIVWYMWAGDEKLAEDDLD